ncbi:MAG: PD-(D/E)XK nuclease-like domain-containing protein [Pseudomonadota bacterium]
MKVTLWHKEVDGPGLYLGIPMTDYRADPCPVPSLNSSVARLCLERSLAHAAAAHPRITPVEPDEDDEESSPTRAMDIGSAAHSLAFGIGARIALIHAKNWRTKAAQEARKAAWAAGEIPLLPKELRRAEAMAAISRPIIDDLLGGSLVAEAMMVWRDAKGFWFRGLIDRMRADARVVIDYKTTGRIASPEEATRLVYSSGAYFQEAFYRRGLDALDPAGVGRRRFCFLYQEQEPPFTACLVELSEAGRSMADEEVQAAINVWQRGLVTGDWPGYPLGPHVASPPDWMMTRWTRRAETDETLNPHFELELS